MQTESIIKKYSSYKEKSLNDRRFKHDDIENLIASLEYNDEFSVNIEGESIEGRNIYSIKWGNGEIDILMWSQMHGDEPTATMAIFDIINFLSAKDHRDFKNKLADNLTLHFVPMLNPDGAELFQRRNALGVDLNRDALRLQSPESKILKEIRDRTDAEFGFNLHDQGRVYAAGISEQPATISFLAPAYNYEKEVNEIRGDAMKVIAMLNRELQKYIPGQIAKYNDDFEPRAFGDNIQKWGTRTILIESGGNRSDREKQVIRKMNFVALLESFVAISSGSYKEEKLEDYEEIPFNEKLLFDLLVTNATVEKDNKKYKLDFGINFMEEEYDDHRKFFLKGVIEEVGDLSIYKGYKTFDASGYELKPGIVYRGAEKLEDLQVKEVIEDGFLFLRGTEKYEEHTFPLNMLSKMGAVEMNFKIGDLANFVIMKDGEVEYAVVNGFLVDLDKIEESEFYGIRVD